MGLSGALPDVCCWSIAYGASQPHAPGSDLDAQKRTEKPLEPGVPDLPLGASLRSRRLGGGFAGDWAESLMDWVPRELKILRVSNLVAWYLNNSACRPFKGVEPSTGNALLKDSRKSSKRSPYPFLRRMSERLCSLFLQVLALP